MSTATDIGTVTRVPLAHVHPDPRNPRISLGDLTELAASIRDGGVRQPITVYPHPDLPGEWMVLFGHRRRQASIDAGQDTVPVIVRDDLDTDAARLVERLIENLDREDLTVIEEATAYEQLVLAGVKPAQIAKRTGRSGKEIAARRALMKLQEETRRKIQARQISLDDAAALVEFTGDKAATKRLEAAAGTEQWRWALQKERDAAARAAKRAAALVDLKASGAKVVEAEDLKGTVWSHQLTYLTLDGGPARGAGLSHDDWLLATVEWHAEQHTDGHAAVVSDNGVVSWVCLDPVLHRSDTDDEDDPDDDDGEPVDEDDEDAIAARAERRAAEQAAAAAKAEQFRADVATAAGIRRDHLSAFITGPAALDRAQEGAIAGLMVRLVASAYVETDCDDIGPWVGVDTSAVQGHDYKAAEARDKEVQDQLAKMGGPAALLAVLAASFEPDMSKTYVWAVGSRELRRGATSRGWLTLLIGSLGYDLTAWEAEQLAAIDGAAVADEVDD